MTLTLYQIDAFASKAFKGNPAAVIPLESWLDDALMQQIAEENNLAETVFFVPKDDGYHIRWFTPEFEINLCGHATLATAFVLYNYLNYQKPSIVFYSKSGPLYVERNGDVFELNFPSWTPEKVEAFPDKLIKGLQLTDYVSVYKNRDYIVELANAEDVLAIQPDFSLLNEIDNVVGVIVTAPGKDCDFVSRFFAPKAGIPEDPVTGSAHSQLIPLWSYKLNKPKMFAKQLSKRGGEIHCELVGDRVIIGGRCVFYMKGEILIN